MAGLGAREGREPRSGRGGAGAGIGGTPVTARLFTLDPGCSPSPAARHFPGPEPRAQGGQSFLFACSARGPTAWTARGLASCSWESLFPAPSHSLGLFPLLLPTSSLQVSNCRPGLGLSDYVACSCQSQKYSLMTQLEDKSPDWLLQAKYRAGGTTCPRPRASTLGLPSHVGLAAAMVEKSPRMSGEGGGWYILSS